MESASKFLMKGTWKHVLATFFVVGAVFAMVFFAEELHLRKFLPYVILAGVAIYLMIFQWYRKEVIRQRKKEKEDYKRSKQPWE